MFGLAFLLLSTATAPDPYSCLGTTAQALLEKPQGKKAEKLKAATAFWLKPVRASVPDTPDASLVEDARISRLDLSAQERKRELRICLRLATGDKPK